MKKIKLTQGKFALVDDEDYEWLSQWKWFFAHGYAAGSIPCGKGKQIYMHILINNTPKGNETDHINRNKLDNRHKNLRTVNKRLNALNRGLQSNNTSGYKGVSWSKIMKKWEAYIWNKQIKIKLGYFENIKIAYLVRCKAERIYHAI